jgi:hypothetical protein
MGEKMVAEIRKCKIKGCKQKHFGLGLCESHYKKEYNQRPHVKARRKKYYDKNRDKIIKKATDWMKEHPERTKELRKKAWENYKKRHGKK